MRLAIPTQKKSVVPGEQTHKQMRSSSAAATLASEIKQPTLPKMTQSEGKKRKKKKKNEQLQLME
jgi:hypothetical protein